MADVVISAAAEADYVEAFCWYAKQSSRAAERFEAELERSLAAIAENPGLYAYCDSRHRRYLMRRYPYQVVYREEREHLVVIAVAHAKRKPRYWQQR